VPLPSGPDVLLGPPDAAEVDLIVRGLHTAVRPAGGLTAVQDVLLRSTVRAMTGHEADLALTEREPLDPEGLARGLTRRNRIFRERILQAMVLPALVLDPLPATVSERVASYGEALGVDDDMLVVAADLAAGSKDLALHDFERSGYTADWSVDTHRVLHTSNPVAGPWGAVADDPALAARWSSLGACAEGTLGLAVWRFYTARGFRFPGSPGSAPPYLAQHDWVHMLADYGSTVESELEVFGLIARATDDPRGFSLLAMVVGLFETGALARGAGLFQADAGHLRRDGMAARLADAMRRGALTTGDQRFLERDWFADADRPVEEVRAEVGIVAKDRDVLAAGSVGPFDPASLSPYQHRAGQALATEEGREYDAWGAGVAG